jgi:hypothetical protein
VPAGDKKASPRDHGEGETPARRPLPHPLSSAGVNGDPQGRAFWLTNQFTIYPLIIVNRKFGGLQ